MRNPCKYCLSLPKCIGKVSLNENGILDLNDIFNIIDDCPLANRFAVTINFERLYNYNDKTTKYIPENVLEISKYFAHIKKRIGNK